MSSPDVEKLFLIEVFLDSVYIDMTTVEVPQPQVKERMRETCVMFSFLHYPELVLCEEDFFKAPPRGSGTADVFIFFKAGKSCLFSVPSSQSVTIPPKFDIVVTVYRKVDIPDMKLYDVGFSRIDLGDSFRAIMQPSAADPEFPLVKTKHGTFDIVKGDTVVGTIAGLVRLSCFGQLIVTQFQVGAKDDAFMFKGTEAKELIEIPGDSTKKPKIEVDPNYVPPPTPVDTGYPGGDVGGGYGPIEPPMDFYPPVVAPLPPPPPPEEPGNYKEIVAEIRGHSLHIRVPMRPKKEKEICKKQLVEEMEGPVCKFAPQLNLCDCDYPVPPEAVPRCPPR